MFATTTLDKVYDLCSKEPKSTMLFKHYLPRNHHQESFKKTLKFKKKSEKEREIEALIFQYQKEQMLKNKNREKKPKK